MYHYSKVNMSSHSQKKKEKKIRSEAMSMDEELMTEAIGSRPG